MNPMSQQPGSWTGSKRVASEELHLRLQSVHVLREDELELYEISKDKETGEHYLHYAYVHRNLSAQGPAAGEQESFHHLMPLDSDAVLGLMFNDDRYAYPAHWERPFLRNGPEGDYVWFDPGYAAEEAANEAWGRNLAEQLALFKAGGEVSEDAVRELLSRLDRENKDGNGENA